ERDVEPDLGLDDLAVREGAELARHAEHLGAELAAHRDAAPAEDGVVAEPRREADGVVRAHADAGPRDRVLAVDAVVRDVAEDLGLTRRGHAAARLVAAGRVEADEGAAAVRVDVAGVRAEEALRGRLVAGAAAGEAGAVEVL